MSIRREFNLLFKLMVVEEFQSRKFHLGSLARRYNLSPHLIIQWRKAYSEGKLAINNDQRIVHSDAGTRELKHMS